MPRWGIFLGIVVSVYLVLLLFLWINFESGAGDLAACLFALAVALNSLQRVVFSCSLAIGFWRLHARGADKAAGNASSLAPPACLQSRVAMVMTVRNEDPARAMTRMRAMFEGVEATGEGKSFDWHLLSDTDNSAIAACEEAEIGVWRRQAGDAGKRIRYRRRLANIDFKAGNIWDFCEKQGAGYEFMIVLDADSLMDGETILRLVRLAEADPAIGILQTTIAPSPAASAFARIQQFADRRLALLGALSMHWWMPGGRGLYYGHNALVRIAPFLSHCQLPTLPGGAAILSHDHIEAMLMHDAGYEVRNLPLEGGSYEDTPPNLLEFIRRERRWCKGGLQHLHLLTNRRLSLMSRVLIVWMVGVFIGQAVWAAISFAAIVMNACLPGLTVKAPLAYPLYVLFLAYLLTTKALVVMSILLSSGEARRLGGVPRLIVSALIELPFACVRSAVVCLSLLVFMLGLPFPQKANWDGQRRDPHRLPFASAARALWPSMLAGLSLAMVETVASGSLRASPFALIYLAGIPLATLTASPWLGLKFAKWRFFATPEEIDEPAIFRRLRRLSSSRETTEHVVRASPLPTARPINAS